MPNEKKFCPFQKTITKQWETESGGTAGYGQMAECSREECSCWDAEASGCSSFQSTYEKEEVD